MEHPISSNLFDLQLDQQAGAYLGETARWARFLSILGFIFCGLLVLVALFKSTTLTGTLSSMNGNLTRLGSGAVSMIYILLALLYFFPCFYLFHFGAKMRTALRNNDQETLSASFKNLKSCFKFFGVLSIVVLCFYVLIILAFIIGGFAGR